MVETPGPHQRTTTSLKPPSGATVGSTPEKTLYPEVEQAHTKSIATISNQNRSKPLQSAQPSSEGSGEDMAEGANKASCKLL